MDDVTDNPTPESIDEVVNSKATVARGEVEGRPFLDLALFWGSNGRGQPISSLRPEDADQHGRFYPATDDESAVVHLPLAEYPDPVRAGLELRSILTRHGVSLNSTRHQGRASGYFPARLAEESRPLSLPSALSRFGSARTVPERLTRRRPSASVPTSVTLLRNGQPRHGKASAERRRGQP